MGPRRIIDTNVAWYLFKGRIFLPTQDGPYAVSIITQIELLSTPDLTGEEESGVRSFLFDIDVLPLTDEISEGAIQLCRKYRLKTPDAIICATANVLGLPLLTNDGQLLGCAGVQTIQIAG